MPKALQHEYPSWETPAYDDGSSTGEDPREMWFGAMRVVSPRRARKLRKRGVPLMPLHAVHTVYVQHSAAVTKAENMPTTPGNGPGKQSARYAWFEHDVDVADRKYRRGVRCYNAWRRAESGVAGRKYELRNALQSQRVLHAEANARTRCARVRREIERVLQAWRPAGVLMPPDTYAARSSTYTATYTGASHGEVLLFVPGILQHEDETDREFVQRHLAAGNVPAVSDLTPQQLEAVAAVDMSDVQGALKRPRAACTGSCLSRGTCNCQHKGAQDNLTR